MNNNFPTKVIALKAGDKVISISKDLAYGKIGIIKGSCLVKELKGTGYAVEFEEKLNSGFNKEAELKFNIKEDHGAFLKITNLRKIISENFNVQEFLNTLSTKKDTKLEQNNLINKSEVSSNIEDNNEIHILKSKINILESQLEDKNNNDKEINLLTQENNNLKVKLDEYEKLKNNFERLNNKNIELEKELNNIKENNNNLIKIKSDFENIKTELNKEKEKNNKLQLENNDILNKLKDVGKNNVIENKFETEFEKIKLANNALEDKLLSANNKIDTLTAQIDELQCDKEIFNLELELILKEENPSKDNEELFDNFCKLQAYCNIITDKYEEKISKLNDKLIKNKENGNIINNKDYDDVLNIKDEEINRLTKEIENMKEAESFLNKASNELLKKDEIISKLEEKIKENETINKENEEIQKLQEEIIEDLNNDIVKLKENEEILSNIIIEKDEDINHKITVITKFKEKINNMKMEYENIKLRINENNNTTINNIKNYNVTNNDITIEKYKYCKKYIDNLYKDYYNTNIISYLPQNIIDNIGKNIFDEYIKIKNQEVLNKIIIDAILNIYLSDSDLIIENQIFYDFLNTLIIELIKLSKNIFILTNNFFLLEDKEHFKNFINSNLYMNIKAINSKLKILYKNIKSDELSSNYDIDDIININNSFESKINDDIFNEKLIKKANIIYNISYSYYNLTKYKLDEANLDNVNVKIINNNLKLISNIFIKTLFITDINEELLTGSKVLLTDDRNYDFKDFIIKLNLKNKNVFTNKNIIFNRNILNISEIFNSIEENINLNKQLTADILESNIKIEKISKENSENELIILNLQKKNNELQLKINSLNNLEYEKNSLMQKNKFLEKRNQDLNTKLESLNNNKPNSTPNNALNKLTNIGTKIINNNRLLGICKTKSNINEVNDEIQINKKDYKYRDKYEINSLNNILKNVKNNTINSNIKGIINYFEEDIYNDFPELCSNNKITNKVSNKGKELYNKISKNKKDFILKLSQIELINKNDKQCIEKYNKQKSEFNEDIRYFNNEYYNELLGNINEFKEDNIELKNINPKKEKIIGVLNFIDNNNNLKNDSLNKLII